MAPDTKPGDGEIKGKRSGAPTDKSDKADKTGKDVPEGPADSAATSDSSGGAASEADAIRRIQSSGRDWEQPALSGRLVDEVLRRIRDEGILSGQTVYNTNIYDAEFKGSLSVGKARTKPEPPRHIHQVRVDALDLVREVFVTPDGITDAASVFRSRRMVVLRGAPASGRQTAALWLAATAVPADRVYILRADRLLTVVRGGQLDKNATYIVPGLDRDTAARLDDFALGEIGEWLSMGRRLVITVDSSVPLHHDFFTGNEVVIDAVGCPNPVDVARNHGRYELAGTQPAGADEPGRVPELRELIDRLLSWLTDAEIVAWLRARPQPAFAALAGRTLAIAASHNEDPKAALFPLENPQEHAEQWFQQHTGPVERSLLVAASVLGGASYLSVVDAAAALGRELTGLKSPRHDCPSFWPFINDEPWLEVTEIHHASPLGGLPVEVVRFRNGRTQTAVLEYAWRRLDGMRRAMSNWLKALGGTSDPEISARAAAAVGIVSLFDFQYALDNVLLTWAASEDAARREAAALALSFPAGDGRYRDPVWRLLLSWYDPATASLEVTQTAISALGGPLGAHEPEAALAALREILETWDWEYALDVARSLILLIAGGHAASVLSALREWSGGGPPSRTNDGQLRLIGLSCFLVCVTPFTAGPGQAPRPLIVAAVNTGLRPAAELWGRALDTNSLRAWALELLRGWFDLRDSGSDDDQYVIDLVMRIAELDERQRQRLEHHFYKWANDTANPSRTAKEALALLCRPETVKMELS